MIEEFGEFFIFPENLIIIGDINLDSYVNVQDVVIIVSSITASSSYNQIADINSDGYVDVLDIIFLISIIIE